MSYKSEQLIAYLYGELSESDKKEVESLIQHDEEAAKELEELRETLGMMGKLKDKEVEPPTFSFQDSAKVIVGLDSSKSSFRYIAIAASIVLVLLSGYLTGFNLSYSQEKMELSFGGSNDTFSKTQVEDLVARAVEETNQQLVAQLDRQQTDLKNYVSANLEKVDKKLARQVNQSGFEDQKEEYLSILKQMIESSELDQKKYTDEVLTDFAIFLDIQRQNDLNVIQTRFDSFRDDAELNQFQTNQILSNLISNVENTNQY